MRRIENVRIGNAFKIKKGKFDWKQHGINLLFSDSLNDKITPTMWKTAYKGMSKN